MNALIHKLLVGAVLATLATAAPASAQIFFNEYPVERTPIEPNDPIAGEPLPGATAAEARAGLIWNMRAGLNNAALQCQLPVFGYLRITETYNALLAHHGAELRGAYATLEGYFRRTGGARGPRRFDDWSTQAYNRFQTLDAQFAYCQTAGDIAKDALTRRKGQFYNLAHERMRELRSAMRVVTGDRMYVAGRGLRPLPPGLFAAPVCTGLTGRRLQQCEAGETPR